MACKRGHEFTLDSNARKGTKTVEEFMEDIRK
jgi:hypothetical protein